MGLLCLLALSTSIAFSVGALTPEFCVICVLSFLPVHLPSNMPYSVSLWVLFLAHVLSAHYALDP